MKTAAFAALSLLAAISCMFGFFMRGVFDRVRREYEEEKTWRWIEEFEADHDDWSDDIE